MNANIDFSDTIEEKRVFNDIEKNIEYFQYRNEKLPVFIPDFMTTNHIESQLVTAKKLTGEKIEINATKMNIQYLKRTAWTSNELITEQNFQEITGSKIRGLETPLYYDFSETMSIVKIKCWVACSKID